MKFEPWGKYSIEAFLIRYAQKSYWKLFFLIFAAYFIPSSILAFLQGIAMPEKTSFVSFFEDFSTVIDFILLNPLAYVLGCYYYLKVSGCYEILVERKLLIAQGRELDQQVYYYNKKLSSPWISIVSLIIGLGSMIFYSMDLITKVTDYSFRQGSISVTGFYVQLVTGLFISFMIGLIIRSVFIVVFYNRLLKFELRIRPFSNDRCGGLGVLGEVVTIFSSIVLVEFVTVLIMVYHDYYFYNEPLSFRVIWLSGLCIGVSALLFIFLLFPAHFKMKKSKNKLLKKIENVLNEKYNATIEENINKPSFITNADINDLHKDSALIRLYEVTCKYPVWPLNFKLLSSFAGTLAPMITLFFRSFFKLVH